MYIHSNHSDSQEHGRHVRDGDGHEYSHTGDSTSINEYRSMHTCMCTSFTARRSRNGWIFITVQLCQYSYIEHDRKRMSVIIIVMKTVVTAVIKLSTTYMYTSGVHEYVPTLNNNNKMHNGDANIYAEVRDRQRVDLSDASLHLHTSTSEWTRVNISVNTHKYT